VRLIRAQSQRCREILSKITSLSSAPEEHLGHMPLSHLIEEVTAPQRDFGVAIEVEAHGEGPEPVAARNPGLAYGLGNLVENAVDFAERAVRLEASWTPARVRVTIADDGPGYSPDVIDRLGEPYVTTRRAEPQPLGEHGGLGLGIFIAKTLLERSGAKLSLSNRRSPEKGATVTVEWPRAEFERRASPEAASAAAGFARRSLIESA
jgi:two-component system sensor histidine kinase RegB